MESDYSREYFLDEVRDGFFIPSMMKKAWAAMQKSYDAMKKVCDAHGLHAYMMWGSVLGAVRHGGFIPWDDDIDTMMLRDEYEVLKKMYDESELEGEYWLSDYMSSRDENQVRRWIDTKNTIRDPKGSSENYGFPFMNIIDIFLLDYIPKGMYEREAYKNNIQVLANISVEASELQNKDIEGEKIKLNKRFDNIVKKIGLDIDDIKEEELLFTAMKTIDKYCSLYPKEKCNNVAMLTYYFDNQGRIIPREWVSSGIDMCFENSRVTVPIGYDGILRRFWGNYMYPVLLFGGHEYPFYRSMESQMADIYKYELFSYHIYSDEYIKNVAKVPDADRLSDYIKETVNILHEAHQFIYNAIANKQKLEAVMDILGQCQELAVGLGERIEQNGLECKKYISILEVYCELTFDFYQKICDGVENGIYEDGSAECDRLRGYDDKLDEMAFADILEKKEVVFLVYRSNHWKSLHSIWQEAICDESYNVTVIAVPYYYKEYDGSTDKDSTVLETGYPDEVEITAYDAYDFEINHPDVVIYQCPYDGYSDAMTLHPYYYASNLRKYVEKMVLIPPFTLREIEPENIRMKMTLKDYLETPGTVYADMIVVQSEGMKDVYTELLNEFVIGELGDEIKNIDELAPLHDMGCRISASGSAIYDWDSRVNRVYCFSDEDVLNNKIYDKRDDVVESEMYDDIVTVPESWESKIRKTDNSIRKVILSFVGASMLLTTSDASNQLLLTEKKINNILSAKDEPVVLLIEDQYAKDILKNNRPSIFVEYDKLLKKLSDNNRVIIDNTSEYIRAATIADAYYGDACVAMNECRVQGKPVLWETPGSSVEASDKYKNKTWNENILVAVEGEDENQWNLMNFIEEALSYEVKKPSDGNGKRIWEKIREKL